MEEWYKLDNAGKLFRAVSEPGSSSVFRIAVVMTEAVDKMKLQRALDDTIKRLPMFAVKLRKGVFWDFLVDNSEKLFIQEETDYPCAPIDPIETNGFLLRVIYYKKRIAVEFFHAMTDGTGAFEFLKLLIFNYLTRLEKDVTYESALIDMKQEANFYEKDDSYQNYSQKKSHKVSKENLSYQIKGIPIDQTVVVHGKMRTSQLLKIAKAYDTTLTVFVTAVLISAIYKERLKFRTKKERINIAIPVNLRHYFPSTTLRNFFGVVNVGMVVDESTSLEDMIPVLTQQMKEKLTREKLQHSIDDRVKWQKMLTARFVPLPLKYRAIRFGYSSFSEKKKAMTLTNMGRVDFTDTMAEYIEHMEMVMYPTKKSPINGGIAAVGDALVISFARMIQEADIVRAFFKELASTYKLDIEVYSNDRR